MTTEERAQQEYPDPGPENEFEHWFELVQDQRRLERAAYLKGYAAGQEDRWKSVDERLPELNLDVFFWANGTWHWGFRSTADFGEANHVWIAHGEDGDDCEVDEDEVTHWQPEFRAPSTPVTK